MINTEIEYAYDELRRLKTVTAKKLEGLTLSTPLVTAYFYDAAGNLDTISFPNGIFSDYDLDALKRVELLRHFKDGVLLASYDYTIGADGQREAAVESIRQNDGSYRNVSIDWTYDALNRLTLESYDAPGTSEDYTATYTLDLVGNRLTKVLDKEGTSNDRTSEYVYNVNDQLTSETTAGVVTAYTYDANGSTTQVLVGGNVVGVYTWNLRNYMTGAVVDGLVNSYAYDANGHRASKTVNGQRTDFVVDAQNPTGYAKALEERSSTGTLIRAYIFGLDVIGQDDVGSPLYLLKDAHGTTRLSTDSGGSVSERYDFDAFLVALNFDADLAATIWLSSDASWDGETGLWFHIRRYRDEERMFASDDYPGRTEEPLSLHKYLYADGNPVNNVDPSGYFTVQELVQVMGKQLQLFRQRLTKARKAAVKAYRILVEASVRANYIHSLMDQKLYPSIIFAGPYQEKQLRDFRRIPDSQLKLMQGILKIVEVATSNVALHMLQDEAGQLAQVLGGGSIPIKPTGHPDFSNYMYKGFRPVVFIPLSGRREKDNKLADLARGLPRPPGYVWHHHEVLGIMQLVDAKVNNADLGGISHRGGAFYWSILNNKKYA